MKRNASVERDGVKLTLRLPSNPMYSGLVQRIELTVTNTGTSTLHWLTDGCEQNMWLRAEVEDAAWRPSDVAVSAEVEPYRQWLQENSGASGPIVLNFDHPALMGYRSHGCADVGVPHELAPGAKVTQTQAWNGYAAPRLGLPPSGPVTITGTFDGWWRGAKERRNEPIEVSLDSWVISDLHPSALSPLEIIDAAVADTRLASWLVTRPLHQSAEAVADFDVNAGVWLVGLVSYEGDGRVVLHAAYVDPLSGEVFAVRESLVRE